MKTLQYKDKNGNWINFPIIQTGSVLPENGEAGQILTKTEEGAEWKNAPSTEGLLTEEKAKELYQPVGDYLTEHQDISNLATKDELSKAIEDSEAKIFGDGELAEAFDTIQEIGEYLKDHDEVAEAINEAIAKKADKTELENYYTKTEVDSKFKEYTTSTNIASTPITHRLVITSISASASFGLDGTMVAGQELHVIVNNTGSETITVAIPSTFEANGTDNISVDSGKYGEINVISDGTKLYLRAV